MDRAAWLYPLVIVVVMFGMGMSLTLDDFRRGLQLRRPLAMALVCQVLVLPVAAAAIAQIFSLPAVMAVGLVLTAAVPGGTMANILSHVLGGDLALNLTLTAFNALVGVVSIPLIVFLSMSWFMDREQLIPPQVGKLVQLMSLVIGPIAVGMVIRSRLVGIADRLHRPVRVLAALCVVVVVVATITGSWNVLVANAPALGGAALTFSLLSLSVGYAVPRVLGTSGKQAVAICLEIGLHNAVLAMAIAMSPQLLNEPEMAAAPMLYGIVAVLVAIPFVGVVRWFDRRRV